MNNARHKGNVDYVLQARCRMLRQKSYRVVSVLRNSDKSFKAGWSIFQYPSWAAIPTVVPDTGIEAKKACARALVSFFG